MQPNPEPESVCQQLFEQYDLTGLIFAAQTQGWQAVWQKFDDLHQNHPFGSPAEKNVFTDLFLTNCLKCVPVENGQALCDIIDRWLSCRKLSDRSALVPRDEQAAALYFCLELRERLCGYLLETSYRQLSGLSERDQKNLLTLWHQFFLNPFAIINMLWDKKDCQQDPAFKKKLQAKGFPGLLAAAMYFPLDADDFDIDSEQLFACELSLYQKTIILRWMVNIPYFNGELKHRDRLVRFVPELCRALLNHEDLVTQAYFVSIVQEIMASFWRCSYIGGNNLEALSAFGDFISATINRFCAGMLPPAKRQTKPGEKLRIGYISRNIYRQAVSYYMINRIIHHDRDKFEISIFALGEHNDVFTDLFKQNSDHFERFPDLQNFTTIINSIIASKLDILIYTDIGMDVVTYILAGLRLAPIQCAMVGHGTTTGLPTIDYYLSGDFEAATAQAQYREKLIRLPNLGAAQYLPDPPLPAISRAGLGVPEDAVLFISCANGIKHRAEREELYLEILRRAPNAWILLKPYTTPDGLDSRLAKRLRTRAAEKGVSERLVIMPSINHYRNVLGLLSIADVQIDTYPYGGWTTNMEALYMGLPIITQEGELSRSRWGAGMLRAMGIEEGIAASEEEFVQWAVRFAENRELRQRVAGRIKERAIDTLFNGPAAQAAFEKALLDLAGVGEQIPPENNAGRKQLGRISVTLPRKVYAVTSIAPKDYPGQRAALDTWRQAGFQVVALNPAAEIDGLRQHFPDIGFVAADRDARAEYKKPYVYFDDLLAYLARTGAPAGGIINADVHLINSGLYDHLASQTVESVLFGSRFETKSLAAKEGKIYNLGFDFFFFSQRFLTGFPQESFCLGLPWWDFWAALVPLARGWPLKRLVTPAALHISHQAAWDKETWLSLGQRLAGRFPASAPVTTETVLPYLHQCAQKINQDSVDILL